MQQLQFQNPSGLTQLEEFFPHILLIQAALAGALLICSTQGPGRGHSKSTCVCAITRRCCENAARLRLAPGTSARVPVSSDKTNHMAKTSFKGDKKGQSYLMRKEIRIFKTAQMTLSKRGIIPNIRLFRFLFHLFNVYFQSMKEVESLLI